MGWGLEGGGLREKGGLISGLFDGFGKRNESFLTGRLEFYLKGLSVHCAHNIHQIA